MNNIYIFGHKKPDTDSVTSAIVLSNLKNELGFKTEPRVLGDINSETNFVLNYFKVEAPRYLNDVKLQLKDLNYQKNFTIEKHCSIEEAYQMMRETNISSIPVIDNNKKFLGTASMKDIAKDLIGEQEIKLNTSYDNIVKTLQGKPFLKISEEIKGNILIASYRSTTFMENVDIDENTILIVGDRQSVIEYAIKNKAKLIILTGNSYIKDRHLNLARKNKVNIIKTDFDTFNTSRRVILSNYILNITTNNKIISFNENEYVRDFTEIANKTKFSNFPIVNDSNKCLGILRLADVSDKNRKQVILVDHNETSQSVDGIEEADIIEIVDHHKIGTIGTSKPINFRNMPLGSTNSILYKLYKETNTPISQKMAGLMLSGIISDTLLFMSPTTTETDKKIAHELAIIAEIDLDEFGKSMFKEGSILKGKTKEQILYSDFKNFSINNEKIGIGQINTLNGDEILDDTKEYVELINRVATMNDYLIVALFATDLINKGSYVFFNDKAKDILENSFGIENLTQGYFIKDCMSRKKQIIPPIMNILEKNI